MVNIFEQSKPLSGKFFPFLNVGDEIQGTYVGKVHVTNDKFRGNCYNYEIIDEEGNMWIIGGKSNGAEQDTKQVFDRTMRTIAPGQIVGFRFVKEVDTGKGNPLKQIDIYANPKFVNEEWLQQQEARKASEEMTGQETPLPTTEKAAEVPVAVGGQQVSFSEPPTAQAHQQEDKISRIQVLAAEKLGVTDAEAVRDAVMEATGLAFLPANLDKIIGILENK